MGPLGDIMPEKDADASSEIVEFTESAITKGDSVALGAHDTTGTKDVVAEEIAKIDKPSKTDEPKPTMYHGVEFPAYFQGPHFIDIKGSLVMAIDPRCVTMGMKSNWERYRHELAALGKQVIEKNLNIKIETV